MTTTTTTAQHEYQVVEDNAGGLTLYVFAGLNEDGIDGGTVVYAHSGYEYVDGQLMQDLDALDAGAAIADFEGCEDDPKRLYAELDDFGGWNIVCDGHGGKRHLASHWMGSAAHRAFGTGEQ